MRTNLVTLVSRKGSTLRSWFNWTVFMIILGVGYTLNNKTILNGTHVPITYWYPEIFIGVTHAICFFIGLIMIANRLSVPAMAYRMTGWTIATLWVLLISARVGQHLMWFSFGAGAFYVFSLRKYSYAVSEKVQSARERKWLDRNLNEKEWTWEQSVRPEYKGSKEARLEKERTQKWEWLHGIAPAIAVWMSRYLGVDITLAVLSIILYYISMVFFKGLFESIGILHRLLLWEKAEGKRFMLPSANFPIDSGKQKK